MSAASPSGASLASAQERFTATLSAVEDAVRYAFRGRLRAQEYEEALAEAVAAAWSAWHGLLGRGKDPVAVGVHGIATNAIRWVRSGRKVGNRNRGRGAMDVYHRKAQAACGFEVVSLDSGDGGDDENSTRAAWRGWLAEDNRCSPADQAAFRVDLESWLSRLPGRKRRVFELLSAGHDGLSVARDLGCSPGRVSQVRAELRADWEAFQGQALATPGRATPARGDASRRRGRPRRTGLAPGDVATCPNP